MTMNQPIYSPVHDIQEDARTRLRMINEQGRCAGVNNKNFYGSDERDTSIVPKDVQDLCESCPIISECLDYALRYERFNIWANTTEKERKMLRTMWGFRYTDPWLRQIHPRGPQPKTDVKVKHGTNTGYKQELRLSIVPCDECRNAHYLATANSKAKAAARKIDEQTQETENA